jgi:general L-amino acid transport system permease protein
MDVTGTLGGITLNQTGRAIESVLLLMLFYLVISLSISAAMNAYNNAMKLKER